MAPSLAELLNQTIYAERLKGHWAGPAVEALSASLYDIDPMGLRGFGGLPRNEYEGEAALAVALALGCEDADALLALAAPPEAAAAAPPEASDLAAALTTAFQRLFERDIRFDRNDAAKEAVVVLRDALASLASVAQPMREAMTSSCCSDLPRA